MKELRSSRSEVGEEGEWWRRAASTKYVMQSAIHPAILQDITDDHVLSH